MDADWKFLPYSYNAKTKLAAFSRATNFLPGRMAGNIAGLQSAQHKLRRWARLLQQDDLTQLQGKDIETACASIDNLCRELTYLKNHIELRMGQAREKIKQHKKADEKEQ